MEKDVGLSQTQTGDILTIIRLTFGRDAVEPYWAESMPEENDEWQQFMTPEYCDKFLDSKGKPVTLPLIASHDVPGLFRKTALIRGYTEPGSLTVKIGVDSGKGETKWIASLYDSAELRREKADTSRAKRRRTMSSGAISKQRSKVGPLKTIMLATVPGLEESHHNISIVHNKLKLDELPQVVNTGDLKVLNIDVGVGPCSSLFPCGYCEAIRKGKELVYIEGETCLRTFTRISENNDKHVAQNTVKRLKGEKEDPTGKLNFSCVNQPIIKSDDHGGLVLMAFPPPMLHHRLGIVNKVLENLNNEWENIEEGRDGINEFLRSLNVVKKDYFGNCLEGNDCRRVLAHLDDLKNLLPSELHIFIEFLRTFKAVEDSCGGYTLFPDWEENIDR